MKLIVADIPEEGLHLKGQFESDIFELDESDDYTPIQPVKYDLKVRDLESLIFVEGTLYAPFEGRCRRCLEAFPVHIVIPEWEVDFPLEDEEDPGMIDLGERIREDLLLELPSQLLCEDFIEDRVCPGPTDAHFESTGHTTKDAWSALEGLETDNSDRKH